MHVRSATAEDALIIAHIHVDAWKSAYASIMPESLLTSLDVYARQVHWQKIILENTVSVYVFVDGAGEISGWAAFGKDRERPTKPDLFELHAIYVTPNKFHQGVGTTLLKHGSSKLIEHGMQTLTVWVLKNNIRALNFYFKNGFSTDPIDNKVITRGGTTLHEIKLVWRPTAPPL